MTWRVTEAEKARLRWTSLRAGTEIVPVETGGNKEANPEQTDGGGSGAGTNSRGRQRGQQEPWGWAFSLFSKSELSGLRPLSFRDVGSREWRTGEPLVRTVETADASLPDV